MTALHAAAGACADHCLWELMQYKAHVRLSSEQRKFALQLAQACEAPKGNQARCIAMLMEVMVGCENRSRSIC